MSEPHAPVPRFPLLDALRDLGKSGAAIEASMLTTFTFNAAFYEEVLLRAFERAGSRLNIVIVDARQLAASVDDPLRQPTRAGRDYLLAPVAYAAAFHPKVLALLSEKTSVLSIGSHNATDPGFSHNEEVTTFWGPACRGPPRGLLLDVLEYCLFWLRSSGAAQGRLLDEIEQRIRHLGGLAKESDQSECRFLGAHSQTQSLWAQTVGQIALPVHRVCIVGPYFDADLRMLKSISQDLSPTEMIVGLQPGTAVLEAPDAAPVGTRFVDSAAMGAFWTSTPGAGFAHGKAILFETGDGPVVCLGSANPTGAGWLGGKHSNAEANVLLTGSVAVKAATELGLHVLMEASSISPETLQAVATRSQEQRERERERDVTINSTPVIVGVRQGDAITVAGVDLGDCQSLVSLQGTIEFRSTNFTATEGGVIFTTDPPLREGGLVRIDGAEGARAIVVINDEQALRDATRPKAAAKLLDHLGRLDSYDGFDEIFDLLQRHVFDEVEPSGKGGASKAKASTPDETNPQPEPGVALPFGPRGVSLATIQKPGHQNHLLENGLVSEVIAALIRAIGPASKPVLDGDGRNIDAEDASPNELSADDVAQSEEVNFDRPDVDWPRLVVACRKRIGVMINRLKDKLGAPISGPERASWLFNRILLVLCLLQRLRTLAPASSVALDGRRRPASLVGVNQLREAFKVAMQGMYGGPGIARLLEASPRHRASDDRALFDDVLLWTAHEIGADYEEKPVFNEQPIEKARRLGDRADIVVVATSAAAHPLAQEVGALDYPSSRIWDDANTPSSDWFERHRGLGAALQSGLAGKRLPTLKRKPKVGEFAFWVAEPGLPRLVRAVSGDKVTLFEPGADDVSGRKIAAAYLDAIDLDAIVASVATT
jgi:hypothetical protein